MTKLIVRVMDGDPAVPEHGRMLGWQEASAILRGDGQVSVMADVAVPVETAGAVRYVSVHWVDVNVDVRLPLPVPTPVRVGDVVTPIVAGPVFRVGPQAGGLPPITTRGSVTVSVLAGVLGAEGRR